MPNIRQPRNASMQYWPRKRAARQYPRIRSWPHLDQAKLLGFAGYKVGMTHIIVTDNRKFSKTKGEEVSFPVTVIECPPLKVASIRLYRQTQDGLQVAKEIFGKTDKELARKLPLPKSPANAAEMGIKPEGYIDVRINVYTQPKLTGIGKKKPELFELGISGKTVADKLKFAIDSLGKELFLKDIFKEGQQVDMHAVTKGKGFQGPVKRFGVAVRQHKAEKTKRGPGSLGGWRGQGHVMYRVAHAGQMGYHTRTEFNKQILKIGDKTEEVNRNGGYKNYGIVRNSYMLIKGSVFGPSRRLVRFCTATRKNKLIPEEPFSVEYIRK
jgi:large subunit ribosomal protein L3